MARRAQLIPWKSAGRVSERQASGDDVVRETGWVFNNATGDQLTLAEFVATGDDEVPTYVDLFRLRGDDPSTETLVEIGSGIGRMTCAFTRQFGCVVACDLDAGFLERCRETVARFGKADRLRTSEVADGRTLALPSASADAVFSYITLQHCDHDDALDLVSEAVRVARPGGRIALNFRARAASDAILLPIGSLARSMFRLPGVGEWLSRRRALTRFAWQANRLDPDQVIGPILAQLADVQLWRHPTGTVSAYGAATQTFEGINPHHWWLVATVTTPDPGELNQGQGPAPA
jgi:SAM-dependent methyltransferase